MTTFSFDKHAPIPARKRAHVLELRVKNHPGVMSHVCGLFARRAFNVEKILCLPQEGGEESRIWLTVNEDCRLDQIEKQLLKLEDILEVRHAEEKKEVFGRIEAWLQENENSPSRGEGRVDFVLAFEKGRILGFLDEIP